MPRRFGGRASVVDGAFDYLSKPFKKEQLVQVLERWVAREPGEAQAA